VLLDKIRSRFASLLNGYLGDLSETDVSDWITTSSSYGPDVGLMGAFVLAQQAIDEHQHQHQRSDNRDDEDDTERAMLLAPASSIPKKEEEHDDDDDDDDDDDATMKKRTAYNAGLWHGIVLGLSASYVGIVLYAHRLRVSSGGTHRR